MHAFNRPAPLAAPLAAALALWACHDAAPEAALDVVTSEDSSPAAPDLPAGLDLAEPAPDAVVTFDVASPDAAPPADALDPSGPCDTFGCACAGNADCLDGLCVEGLDGGVCTRLCESECPDGYDCLLSASSGDPKSICIPRHTRLCRPCRDHGACQNPADPFPSRCLPAADPADGSFCASSCASRPCPDGYACESVEVDGASARLCVPSDSACSCRPAWADFGLSTACLVENAFGACEGSRGCGPDGLTACTGPEASAEVCDAADNDCDGTADNIAPRSCEVVNVHGVCPGQTGCTPDGRAEACLGREAAPELCNRSDDDCDGDIDEGTCDDGLACTADACAGDGVCDHALLPGFCRVGDACWAAGEANPQNACEVCSPSSNPGVWSQTPNTCVIAGRCFAAGAVNPGNACQTCSPGLNATGWSPTANTCTIGGSCYAAGQANPARPCEVCQPSVSTVAWTQASNTCNIGGTCYAAGVAQPGQPCFVCDPSRSAASWSPAVAGTTCDDGNACSPTSTCNGAGVCAGDTSCNDGVACTTDRCTATGCDNSQVADGWCRIGRSCFSASAPNPGNPCQACLPTATQASRTAWSNQPSSTTCNDGNACTLDDRCSGTGTCNPGTPKSCSDGLACTSDTCNPTNGACSSALTAGNCLISGTCYANNATQPNNVCYKCSATAASVWSLNNGATCNDGDACTSSDTCASGACTGTPQTDAREPNNAPNGHNVGSVDDGAGWTDASSFTANLYPSGDVDWYTFQLRDPGNTRDPTPSVELSGVPAGYNYGLCVYYRCGDGSSPSFSCDRGTRVEPTAGIPWAGCCDASGSATSRRVRFVPDCRATDDTGDAFIRVFNVGGSSAWTCGSHTVKWGDSNCGVFDSAAQCL
jgi:hypothetical protein